MSAVEEALSLWGMAGAEATLAAERENKVYSVRHGRARYALRLHRRGYRTDAEIRSELDWMAAAARGGVSVPAPVASLSGAYLEQASGWQVDMLTWMAGGTLAEALPDAAPERRAALFAALGAQMARLHLASDAWTPPQGFTRAAWDAEGLLGDAPLWGPFWENPTLSEAERALLVRFRDAARDWLAGPGAGLDFGLIHADLVPENVLVDGDALTLIDFDDGGAGFRLFDVATALIKHHGAPDFDTCREALLAGYRQHRALETQALDFFLALRAVTYLGWIIPRMDEAGGAQRNARFLRNARHYVTIWMNSAGPHR